MIHSFVLRFRCVQRQPALFRALQLDLQVEKAQQVPEAEDADEVILLGDEKTAQPTALHFCESL